MTVHMTDDVDWRPADGWFTARCSCGWSDGPFPDIETMVDALMDHAADAAQPEPTVAAGRGPEAIDREYEERKQAHRTEQEQSPAEPPAGDDLREAAGRLLAETDIWFNGGNYSYNDRERFDAAREVVRAALRDPAPLAAEDRSQVAWLIERGQPEGQAPTVWWAGWSYEDHDRWITDTYKATWFATRDEAEQVLADRGWDKAHVARAVEHGFVVTARATHE